MNDDYRQVVTVVASKSLDEHADWLRVNSSGLSDGVSE